MRAAEPPSVQVMAGAGIHNLRKLAAVFAVWVAANLTGCSSAKPAPIFAPRASVQTSALSSGSHMVQAGDTLYSIAFVYGLNYQELARWNKLGKDYQIKIGQRLRLSGDGAMPPITPATTEKKRKNSQKIGENVKKASKNALDNRINTSSKELVATVVPVSAASSLQDPKLPVTSVTARAAVASNPNPTGKKQEPSNTNFSPLFWSWPSSGAVLQSYSELVTGNKGLNIAGKSGEPVRAAAPGRVVYAGSGLRGFGQLIILKHTDEFLSAYAHNSQLHVREDEVVKAGQVIADIGNSGTDRVQLHFEIRYLGVPVDPLKYLPKR